MNMSAICGDNRFEVIAEAKKDLLESTNIEMSPDEMSVIDNILFRCWQMGWLRQYETYEFCDGENPCKEYDQEKHCCHRWSKVIRQTIAEVKQQYALEHPVIVHCNECFYAESADEKEDGYRCTHAMNQNRSVIWFGGDFCSYGERNDE